MKNIKEIFIENKIILGLGVIFTILMITAFVTVNTSESKVTKLEKQNEDLKTTYSILDSENKDLCNKIEIEKVNNKELSDTNESISANNLNKPINESKWEGKYTVDQEDISLELEINSHNAIFKFGPTSENTDTEYGSYYMGKEVVDQKTGLVKLRATEWIDKPVGYNKLNIIGIVKGNYMTGAVVDKYNKKIGTISLSRTN